MNDVVTPPPLPAKEQGPRTSDDGQPQRWSMLRSASREFPLVQLLVLAAVFAWGAVQIDGFASEPSIRAMLVIGSLLALASLGQTLVILVGGLDLAVPGYIAVGAVAAAELGGTRAWPLWQVVVAVVAVCALAGAFCGAVCHFLRVQSLVVTLGMSSVLIGGLIVATESKILGQPPESLGKWSFVLGDTFGLPVPPIVCLTAGVVIASWLVLSRTPPGRRLHATGANPRAAEGILIHAGRIRIGTFAFAAAATGLAGMLIAGFTSGASVTTGDPYFYSGLAAVLVGGTALGSARGDFLRTVLGALTLTALTTILAGMGYGESDTRVLFGLVIIVVVLAYGRDRRLRDRL